MYVCKRNANLFIWNKIDFDMMLLIDVFEGTLSFVVNLFAEPLYFSFLAKKKKMLKALSHFGISGC